MNKYWLGHINNCPLRIDFLEIMSEALPLEFYSETNKTKENFLCDIYLNGVYDSFDITLKYGYYPLPYVKEIFIIDWKNGFGYNRSSIHLEYWDDKWKIRKEIKISNPALSTRKNTKTDYTVRKDQLYPEIIDYFKILDNNLGKNLLRSYNLNKLI
jgi:hypothetical protein